MRETLYANAVNGDYSKLDLNHYADNVYRNGYMNLSKLSIKQCYISYYDIVEINKCAIVRGHVRIFKMFSGYDTNPHLPLAGTVTFELLIYNAAYNNYIKVVRSLLNAGSQTSAGLMWDSMYGYIKIFKMLIDSGIDITDNKPLIAAIANDGIDVIKLLRKAGMTHPQIQEPLDT
jgi:hypothetical protein